MLTMDRSLLLLGAALLLLGLSSQVVKKHALSPVLLALAAGAAVGPHVLDLVDPAAHTPEHVVLAQLARVALAMSVVDIALRLRPADLRANAWRLVMLLVAVMPAMWLATALGASLLLGLPAGAALLLGACLTPTDPGVASALVTGVTPNRLLPRRVRMTLQGEAAANDGLALPFVVVSGALATTTAGTALPEAVAEAAWKVLLAVAVGAAMGWLLMRIVDWAGVHRMAEEDWFPLAGSALAITVLALTHLLGGTGILAAFVAGVIFSEGVPEGLRRPIHVVHRSLTKVALTAVFLAFGALLPLGEWWPELGAAGIAFALWALVLRRLPAALPAMLATGTGGRSSAFIAWSGPVGTASIYYLAEAHRFGTPAYDELFLAGTAAITVSVVGQAAVSTFAVRRYRSSTGEEVEEGEELELRGALP